MNLELFIAKRLIRGKEYKSSISAPIIKIAITAVALGLIMMLVALATTLGLKQKIREKVAVFNGHIQIFNYDTNVSNESLVPVSTDQFFYPEFNEVSGITHIQAVATKSGIIRTEETFEAILAKGVGTDYDWSAFSEFMVAGRLPKLDANLNDEVIISRILANKLELKVGDKFFSFFLKEGDPSKTPNQRNFEVVGIYDSGFEEFDAQYLFCDIRHIQRMNKWKKDEVGSFEVFIEDFDQLHQKGNEVYGATVSTLDSRTIKDRYAKLFEWIGLFDFNVAIIIGIMIIVAGINMITALLVLILERTPMIGILKAMGSPDWSIRKVFLYNAAYLIGVGLFWGNLIGLLAILGQHWFRWVKFPNAKDYYMTYIPVAIDPTTWVLLNVGVLVLCTAMMLIPSFIITKIKPVKAIKFE
ncbi:ABC transporter permease [Sediminicola luteus]|uniref:Transmembrane permease n=1 Tax=Sediminicola luteus TaxID=319238 RepID=A0A2A4G7R2_9FLAO|nr:FtsX-like permease family protein [Sediminicola luteus]PCE64473.1 transmembrane permease [Sediminicola luteus]